jgi:AcrR family transcriptional regulator
MTLKDVTEMANDESDPTGTRPLRADASRNRARLLEVAYEVFATEGLSVPVRAIARRAGVSTGTLSRHFPTKESLFEAIVVDRIEQLVARADLLAGREEPADAFFGFLRHMVEVGASDRGVGEALVGAGFDVHAAAARADRDVMAALGGLLAAAQRAGAVRADVDAADVKALIVGCLARVDPDAGVTVPEHALAVVCDGLRA